MDDDEDDDGPDVGDNDGDNDKDGNNDEDDDHDVFRPRLSKLKKKRRYASSHVFTNG